MTPDRHWFLRILACAVLSIAAARPAPAAGLGDPPPGFTSATVILLHGFPGAEQ